MRVLLLVCLLAACGRDSQVERERPTAPDPEQAPAIRVHPGEDLVYRYFPDGSREAETATRIEDIPASAREMVIVVPAEPPPAGLAYVADLRTPGPDGTYPYKVVATVDLDQALDASRGAVAAAPVSPSAAPAEAPAATAGEVIMFSASWCGVCSNARRWFRNKGIAYEEKDIEKDPGAREQMMRLAQQAGLPSSRLTGVPVIWVNGRMFPGFDPQAIQAAL